VTDALADRAFPLEVVVATTNIELGLGGTLGAVYSPVPEIVPHTFESVQAGPKIAQVTDEPEPPNTVAVNCWVDAAATIVAPGDIVKTASAFPLLLDCEKFAFLVALPPPPPPATRIVPVPPPHPEKKRSPKNKVTESPKYE
jgi:hypothetical protein